MNTSMLLIVVINLFTLQQCLCNVDDEATLKSQLVYKECNGEQDCDQFKGNEIKHVECVGKKCVCKNEQNITMNCEPEDVKLSNELGMNCPCIIKHHVCVNGKCVCMKNFTASDDNKHCVPVTSQLDQYCEIDLNCQRAEPFSVCLDNKLCNCHPDFIKANKTCFSILAKMDLRCENHGNCSNVTANSMCVASQCVCKSGFVSSREENKCLPVLRFGDSCQESWQCKYHLGEGSKCLHSKCKCGPGYKETQANGKNNSSICVREIAFGMECTTPVDCVRENELTEQTAMECRNNTCDCRSGFTLVDDGRNCKEIDAVGAATQNGINSYYFVLLFVTIFIYMY